MNLRSLLILSVALVVGVLESGTTGAFSQQITNASPQREVWLGPIAPSIYAHKFSDSQYDYLNLFQRDAPWSKSASQLQVFQVTAPVVMGESDETLKTIFADLNRRHIALGIELGLLSGVDTSGNKICGQNVEGYAAADTARVVALRIQKNGGVLRYIAMDEPLWYGHHVRGQNACQASPEALAQEIAARVQIVRKIFPNVKIGDIEPLAPLQTPDWTDEVTQWEKVYRRVAGEPFSFVRADIVWTQPWQHELIVLKQRLHSDGIKLGVVYNGGGDGREQNDRNWTDTAIRRFRMIESDPRMAPDQAVIESWVRWPSRLLPEDTPGTLTNVLLQYESRP